MADMLVFCHTKLNCRLYVVDPTSLLEQCLRDCNVLEGVAENQDGRGLSEQSTQTQIPISFSATTFDEVAILTSMGIGKGEMRIKSINNGVLWFVS